jgi:mannose/fructose/N-acetylgalactosamine-specific phosphotransferase system component IID
MFTFTFGIALGFVLAFLLCLLLVYLIPGKALKFAAKHGPRLAHRIGESNVEALRRIANLL